ncbi:hypothetical protein RchiOBHm_Chr4g0388471 [Rosa chinensis]|uniref:Uncharacterized protein n=1 Tax=Rosa chinensis TaxID=74649 RepID=A0A2P6QPU8_ROSCH|nr:hypothetical protein RchiOBHm_Chr4g0388471 [Rosa chinensis]
MNSVSVLRFGLVLAGPKPKTKPTRFGAVRFFSSSVRFFSVQFFSAAVRVSVRFFFGFRFREPTPSLGPVELEWMRVLDFTLIWKKLA